MIMSQETYSATRSKPGRRAPAKRSMTLKGLTKKFPFVSCDSVYVPANASPKITSAIEGGIICPKVPAAQIVPQDNL